MELWAGAFVGAVFGVVVAELVRWYQRPRVKFVGLESTRPERGLAGGEQYLRRVILEVRGNAPGLSTAVKLRWGDEEGKGTFGKWDETPEPGETNPLTGQWDNKPNLVPQTFFLPLFSGEQYTIPIVIDWSDPSPLPQSSGRLLDVFCGWWYIEKQESPYRLRLKPGDSIAVEVQGLPWATTLFWRRSKSRSFSVEELGAAPYRVESPEHGGPQ